MYEDKLEGSSASSGRNITRVVDAAEITQSEALKLTQQINSLIDRLRSKLYPVVQPSAMQAEADHPSSTALLEDLGMILRNLEDLNNDIRI